MMSPTVHNAYSAAGAPTGHTSAQAPQSMHFSASITNLPSPSEIASTGQPSAQAPQEMHSSEILYAIILSSLYFFYIISPFGRLCNTFSEKFIFFILSKKPREKALFLFKFFYLFCGSSSASSSCLCCLPPRRIFISFAG